MKAAVLILGVTVIVSIPIFGQASGGAGGSGPYAVPSAAAYALLANAAREVVTKASVKDKDVAIYDAQVFGAIPAYQVAILHLQKTMKAMCPAKEASGPFTAALVPSVDLGGAASGLAALITALTPSYAIQGQAISFDNSTFVAAVSKEVGSRVTIPSYLLPATKDKDVKCGTEEKSFSLADLWYSAAAQASELRKQMSEIKGTDKEVEAKKKPIQDQLDAYGKVAEGYLAIDKGTSLLSKLLVVESLVKAIPGTGYTVLDLKLDAVGMEAVTRTWVGFKTTSFSCSVLAHYTVLTLTKTGGTLELKFVKTDTINLLASVKDEGKFATSSKTVPFQGQINGQDPRAKKPE
jgi:hypothetical protein